jgi:hypothetical protein
LLQNASKRLQMIANSTDQHKLPKLLQIWRQDFDSKLTRRLKAGETQSLYNQIQINAAFGH